MLLVLDNLEQVREASADIGELLRRAGKIRILATSRSPLRVSGEQEYPVPGLPSPVDLDRLGPYEREQLPEALRSHDPERLAAFESVRLFVARGGAVRPGFAITAANAADVAAIVAHLGGVPLAIELAAARLRFLTPAAIHERLEGRLDLPGAGAADVPERQRSLRGAIVWSHDLLDRPSRHLFERLAVFVDGFDLARAEAVAAGDADARRRRARRAVVARRPEPRPERRGGRRAAVLDAGADPRVRARAPRRVRRGRGHPRAPRAGVPGAGPGARPRARGGAPARDARPPRARAREPARGDRLGRRPRANPEVALGHHRRGLAVLAEARLPARGADAACRP